MIPDTNVGGNIATINEVSDDQKSTIFDGMPPGLRKKNLKYCPGLVDHYTV